MYEELMNYKLDLSKDQLDSMKSRLEDMTTYVEWHPDGKYLLEDPGREHFSLIAAIANCIELGEAVCICNDKGLAAAALSAGAPEMEVEWYVSSKELPQNEELTVENIGTVTVNYNKVDWKKAAKAKIVIMDTEPKDGESMLTAVSSLLSFGFRGVLILDYLDFNVYTRTLWNRISRLPMVRWYDASAVGHWVGTGILLCSDEWEFTKRSPVMNITSV
jgi:hypothetical protein